MTEAKKSTLQEAFLKKYVFHGLTNLNTGYDVPSIQYFSSDDFAIVLDRVQKFGLGIHGIEPWLNGSFFGVEVVENTGKDTSPTDPNWYLDCFTKFKKQNLDLHYAASYYVPTKVLEAFEEQLHKYVKRD